MCPGRSQVSDLLLTTPCIQHTFLEEHPRRGDMLRLARAVRAVRSLGSVALELCQLSSGEADMFVTVRSAPWDHNAARVILQEAGGCICTMEGERAAPQFKNPPLPPLTAPRCAGCSCRAATEKNSRRSVQKDGARREFQFLK